MSESTSKQVQQLEILYELSMSIGNSLDMRRMLKASLGAFLKKLNCVAGGVYHVSVTEDGERRLEENYTIPRRTSRNAAYQEALAVVGSILADDDLDTCAEKMPIVEEAGSGSFYHLFELPDFGVLILIKKREPLDSLLMKSLRPLFNKLATAANACLLEQQKQEEFQHNETMLGAIINHTTGVIYVKDVDGKYSLINRQYEKLFNVTNKEARGKTDHDLFPAEVADQFHENDLQILRERETVVSEEVIPQEDGLHTYLSVKFPLLDAAGEPYAVAGVSTDVTSVKQTKEELARLGAAIEQSLDGTAVADLDGMLQFVNPAWATMHGYRVEELAGQPLSVFHTKEQLENEVDPFNRQVLEMGNNEGEIWHKRKDGTIFPAWMSVVLFKDDNDEPIGFVASAQDITDRKRIEAGLQEREEDFSSLLEFSREAIGLVNTETGLFENPNRAAEELYGLSSEKLIAVGPAQMSPEFQPDGRPSGEKAMEKIGEAMAGGQPVFEWMHINAAGEEIPCEISLVGMTGKRSHLVRFSAVNIAARKQAQERLRASESRYRTLFDAAADAIELLDGNGVLTDCNEVYLQALGYSRDEAIGKHATEFFTPQGAELFKKMYLKLKEEGYAESELELVRKDGSMTRVWRKARATYGVDGEMNGIVVYNRDITERQRIEEAIEEHAKNLESVAKISVSISAILNASDLLQVVSDITKEQFDLYHVHIYLLNDAGDSLLLSAGAGEVGQALLDERHQIPLNAPQSLVARAARERAPVIVNDAQANDDFMPNPYLPDTRSEMAVPMTVGDRLVGVLDTQSADVGRFTREDANIHRALAAQIAVALENARSFEQSERAIEELDVLTRRLTREGWDAYLKNRQEGKAFVYDLGGVEAMESAVAEPILENASTEVESQTNKALDHGLFVHGEQIGRLALFPDEDMGGVNWDDETAVIMTAVADQLSSRIENLRLTEETERALAQSEEQAKRMAAINQVAQTVSEELDTESMLTAVYTQIQEIMAADSFFVGFYNAETNAVTMPVNFEGEHFRQESLTVPLTPQSRSYQVIHSGQSILRHLTEQEVAAMRKSGANIIGDRSQATTASQLFVPLQSGAERLGVLSVQSYQFNAYTESDVALLEGVANYVAVALENIRLFNETQTRAEQMEAINQVARVASEQLEMDSMLEVVYDQIKAILPVDSFFISFYNAEDNTTSLPLVFEGNHRSRRESMPLSPESSSKKVIDTGKPLLRNLTREEADIVHQRAIEQGLALGDTSDESDTTKSQLFVPLQSGPQVMGVLSVQSYEFNAYTETDMALLTGIANYVAVAVENIRLFTETQQRAAQLEQLAQIEATLSLAKTEEDIIMALAAFADETQAITLHFVEETADDAPKFAYTVAHWEEGQLHPDDEFLLRPFLIEQHAGTNIGLRHPDEVTFIADIENDDRMNAEALEEARHIGYGSVAIVPMRSAGRWQGFVSLKWPEAHKFTDDEIFLWQQLREPVAAVVASRRAFLAQQGALRETELLYEAGEKLNSANSYSDVLDVMRQYTLVGDNAQNVSLNYFSRPWAGDIIPEWVDVLARQTTQAREGTFSETPKRYVLQEFPSASQLLSKESAVLIEDIASDSRFDENARRLYLETYGAVSTIFVPLVVGGQWFGYINAIYQQAMTFPDANVRRLMALAGQAAVSIQSIQLLEETTKRAQREQLLREITTKVRSSSDMESVMRTAVQEVSRALGRRAFIRLGIEGETEA